MIYHRYYTHQAGHGLPIYSGADYQRGHGLGSLFGSLARAAIPLLKDGASYVGKKRLSTGMAVADDVVSGESWRGSLKRRGVDTVDSIRTDAVKRFCPQQGSGQRRRRRQPIKKRSTRKRRVVRRKKQPKKQHRRKPQRKKQRKLIF
jgi:hypothetical protein